MNDIGSTSDIALQVNASSLLMIGLIVFAATLLIVSSQQVLQWLARKLPGRYRYHILALVPIMRLLAITAAITLIIPQIIEPSFENLLALLGAFGLAVGFALRDYISSLVAGIVTLYEMPYRPGDWIKIEGEYGEVKSIGMRAARILTPDDTTVVIPHLKLWDRPILNGNSGSNNLMCVADFYLHPQHDAHVARETLTDVVLTSPFLKIERRIDVIVLEKPWGTHYRVKAYPVDPVEQFHFKTDITVRGKAALSGLGIHFASYPPVFDTGVSA